MIIVSAHELTKTLICAAERCEHDAEPSHHLCYRCQRLDNVKLHETPDVYTGPTLPCCTCKQYKPDEAFSKRQANSSSHRRYRNPECNQCGAKRRRDHRANWTEKQREAERVRSRATRARKRAELNAIRQARA